MTVCGRCRGRRQIRGTQGLDLIRCPDCEGTGVKRQKAALGRNTVSIPVPAGACCVACGEPAVQVHHVIKQQRLDRFLSPTLAQAAKADKRNGVPTCHLCHKGLDDEATQLEDYQLPRGFEAFVAHYEVEVALPRYLAERRAAA